MARWYLTVSSDDTICGCVVVVGVVVVVVPASRQQQSVWSKPPSLITAKTQLYLLCHSKTRLEIC